MIHFSDFMPVRDPATTKLKFNISEGKGGESAWDLLMGDDHERWLDLTRYRDKGNASNDLDAAEHVMAFAQYPRYGVNYFIFGGLFGVRKSVPEVSGGLGYDLTLEDEYQHYIKRLVIKLERPVGQSYLRWYSSISPQAEVYELAPNSKLGDFAGYHNVRLRHADLQRLFRYDEPAWRDALSSVKGVYVITDLSDGMLNVGSASGEANGLWQRWSAYADVKRLTGQNLELKRILETKGEQHIIENFQYSILEIFDPKTRAEVILERETFWKLALDSRAHGLNRN